MRCGGYCGSFAVASRLLLHSRSLRLSLSLGMSLMLTLMLLLPLATRAWLTHLGESVGERVTGNCGTVAQ
jgi:hypothetical protein